MAKAAPPAPPTGVPGELPASTPRDLYPTSDIRFVLLEIGKLSSSVDRLIADVKSHGEKLDEISHKTAYLKGVIATATIFITAVGSLLAWVLSNKWDAVVAAIQSIKH